MEDARGQRRQRERDASLAFVGHAGQRRGEKEGRWGQGYFVVAASFSCHIVRLQGTGAALAQNCT